MLKTKVKKRRFRSLTVTLSIFFLLLTLTILLISSSLILYFNFQIQQQFVISQQKLIANDAADTVKSFVQEKFTIMETTVDIGDLTSDQQREQQQTIDNLLGTEQSFRHLILLNKQDQELVEVSRQSQYINGKLNDRLDSSIFAQTKQGKEYIGSVYIDNLTCEPMVIMAVPVTDVFGVFQGTLIAEVNLKFMWDLVDEIKIGNSGLVYVIDKNGDLIAFGDISRVLKGENLTYLREVNDFVNDKELFADEPIESEGIQGNSVIATYVPLGTPDWVVVTELPVQEAYSTVIYQLEFTVIIIILTITVAVLIGIYLSRKITKPIIKLRDASSKVGEGNFEVNIEIFANNEIGQLARDFNKMIDNLKKSRNELLDVQKTLEEKVEERTSELNEKIAELKQNETAALNIMDDLQDTVKELQQSQSIIKEQNVQLQKLNRIKSNFLNITSHELRTPMSAIKGYIQMMLLGKLGEINEDQKHSMEVILRNSNRLDRLIQDILDISRLESGTMKFVTEKTDVTKMIKEIADTMQASAGLKRIKITSETGMDVPELIIDKDRITQVVVNLINNAIKFSPDGSIINIRTRKEKEDVLFEVQDFGRGVPEEHQKKIFQTFYQVDSGTDVKYGGAGLGLAICYGIIIAHGGRIWVESTGIPGYGSTFRFTLPVESVVNIEERFRGADVFGLETD
jgi:signal transduction histidine kinase